MNLLFYFDLEWLVLEVYMDDDGDDLGLEIVDEEDSSIGLF